MTFNRNKIDSKFKLGLGSRFKVPGEIYMFQNIVCFFICEGPPKWYTTMRIGQFDSKLNFEFERNTDSKRLDLTINSKIRKLNEIEKQILINTLTKKINVNAYEFERAGGRPPVGALNRQTNHIMLVIKNTLNCIRRDNNIPMLKTFSECLDHLIF